MPDFRLLVAWIAAALLPNGPDPILAIYGEQGSAKSTLARIIRRLIDPQASSLLSEPKSEQDLVITAFGGWLLSFDNISAIPVWLSDCLCRLSTGGALAKRGLYTDDQRRVFEVQRPVVVNGIEEFVRRGDLNAYIHNRLDVILSTLEDSPVARAMLQLVGAAALKWTGSAADLHTALTKIVGKKNAASAGWPKTYSRLGNELRRVAPQLRMYG